VSCHCSHVRPSDPPSCCCACCAGVGPCPDQTETPEQLAERNKERKAAKQKAASVVRREAVAVLSPATLTDPAMTLAQPDAAWVLAGEGACGCLVCACFAKQGGGAVPASICMGACI
jgi:hypothetical protein